ncbi:MAG: polymer-forming cytoskeletal protein [Rugosibacter sp.]|nr:polymer-forming cytoskeletal protein [Rugosibacter sp.]
MLKTPGFSTQSDTTNTGRGLFGRSSTPAAPPLAAPAPLRPVATPVTAQAEPAAAVASAEAATSPQAVTASGNRLLVGPDVKLKGAEILDCDTLVVEGRVEATMDSHIIRIAEQGTFCGTVSIDTAEIHGNFEGELTARTQLIIHATGRVTGKIRYGKILIEEGGQICGDIQSTAANESASVARAEPRIMEVVARS